jgi:hypothetical protein
MVKIKDSNYYKWSIEMGDYDRDIDTTRTHAKKIYRKKMTKLIVLIFVYGLSVAAAAYIVIQQL